MDCQEYELRVLELEKKGAKRIRLSMKEEPSKPTLEIHHVRMIGEGEIATIAGLPGKGKTSLLEMFTAAVIDGQYGGIKTTTKNRSVIMVETENTAAAMLLTLKRIMRRVNDHHDKLDSDGELNGLEFYSLGGIDTVNGRRNAVDRAINTRKFDFLIIDGIQQFCDGLNDDRSAQQTVDWLHSIAIKNNLSTIVTIHTNNDGKSLPGHLGAFLAKRSRAVLFATGSKLATTGFPQAKLTYGNVSKFAPVLYYYCENQEMFLVKQREVSETQKGNKEAVGLRHVEVIAKIIEIHKVKKTKAKEILKEMMTSGEITLLGEGKKKCYVWEKN